MKIKCVKCKEDHPPHLGGMIEDDFVCVFCYSATNRLTEIDTGIKESFNGHHQVYFSIGVQTFNLQENEPMDKRTSKERAEWYEKQLKTAFLSLKLQPNPNSFSFTAKAVEIKNTHGEVGVWTDGFGAYSDGENHCAYRLEKDKKYKVTIEEIK